MAKTLKFPSPVWRILKITGIGIAIILILFGIASWIMFEKRNDWLLQQIHSYMNESQSGQLEISSIDLKLFRNFPDITLELNGINYYEHRDSLRTPFERPILQAAKLYIAVEFMPLLNEELTISEINVADARLNVTRYQNGKLNIELAMASPVKSVTVTQKVITKPAPKLPTDKTEAKPKTKTVPPPETKSAVQIDLQSITLHDFVITWSVYSKPDTSVIDVHEMEIDLVKKENNVAVRFTTTSDIQSLYINKLIIPAGKLGMHAELKYERDNQHLSIRGADVTFDEFSASIKGNYDHKKNQFLDLQIDASSNDLQLLSIFIKPEVLEQNPDLLKSGDIYARGKIFGELKNGRPKFDFSFGMKNIALKLPGNLGSFKKVGFDGKYKSGDQTDYSSAVLEIKSIRGQFPGGFINGEFKLNNFVEPYLRYNLDAQLKLDGYDRVFKTSAVKNLSGAVSLHADFNGPLKLFGTHEMDSSRSSWIFFKDLSFVFTKTNLPVTGLSGKMENRNNLATIQNLTFSYGRNDMTVNAKVENLMHVLVKKEKEIVASGTLQSRQLFTNDFLFDTLMSAEIQDRISDLSLDFEVKTISKNDSVMSEIAAISFDITNLSAKLDELADLKKVDARGTFSKSEYGLALVLSRFHAIMPQGKLNVSGDLLIPEKRVWKFNARVKAEQFPWTYVKDLIAEIKTGVEPTAKNMPVKQMDILTADLDVSADIITYPFDFSKLEIRNSQINFLPADAKMISVDNLHAAFDKLHFIHPENSGAITGLKNTHGTMDLSQLKMPGLNPVDIKMTIDGLNDTLNIAFASATQKAKNETGNLFADISKKERLYRLHYQVQGASLDYFIKKYYKKKFMEGQIDYALNFQTSGSGMSQIKQNLAGTIEISGDSILLHGVDIDNILKKFKRSQKFNLTDLGAVLIAGPVGLAVTKGTDFVSLATVNLDPSQKTRLTTLYTKWKVENRNLITQDVAFTTPLNRIAINGSIDFARDTIPGLTIAVVDKNGCSLMDQKLYGKTSSLKTGKLNITKTVFGSVINFVNAVVGKDCKPVYTGRVKAPM